MVASEGHAGRRLPADQHGGILSSLFHLILSGTSSLSTSTMSSQPSISTADRERLIQAAIDGGNISQ